MQCTFNHSKFGNIVVDSKYIVKTAVIVTNIGSTAFQNLTIRSLHQISGMILNFIRRITAFFVVMADDIKYSIGRTIADPSAGNMTIFDIYNRMFRIVCLKIVDHDFTIRTKLRSEITCNLL